MTRSIPRNHIISTLTLAASLALAGTAAAEQTGPVTPAEIQQLNEAIEAHGARWTAGETSVSRLPLDARINLLGAQLDDAQTPPPPPTGDRDLPEAFDWRDAGGNYITPIRDQGQCGSCWAFATVGAAEAMFNISAGDPDWDPDLSEQAILSCNEYGSCDGGYNSSALTQLMLDGTTTEECMPYGASDAIQCDEACSDYDDEPWRIAGWDDVPPYESEIKAALLDGPLVAAFEVYSDFMSYQDGVYEHVSGSYLGGHAVLVVGWDDADGAWIVKNSWGTGWGEDTNEASGERGWFRIAYGDCGIDNWMMRVDAVEETECKCDDEDGDGYLPADCDDATCAFAQDCDDTDPTVSPDAVEDCTDGIDNDCDGQADAADDECAQDDPEEGDDDDHGDDEHGDDDNGDDDNGDNGDDDGGSDYLEDIVSELPWACTVTSRTTPATATPAALALLLALTFITRRRQ